VNVINLIKQWCFEKGYECNAPFKYHRDQANYIEINDTLILKLEGSVIKYISSKSKASGMTRMTLGDVSDPDFFSKLDKLAKECCDGRKT
jgi:hypothetical protein